jgi:hypothetical protein
MAVRYPLPSQRYGCSARVALLQSSTLCARTAIVHQVDARQYEIFKVLRMLGNVKEFRKEASGQIHILKSGLFKFLICGHLKFRLTRADDQPLMPKANLGAIYDQMDLAQMPELLLQPLSGDGGVPFPYSIRWVVQQPAQAVGHAQQLGRTRDFPRYAAQAHRAGLIDANDQPDKVANFSDPLI